MSNLIFNNFYCHSSYSNGYNVDEGNLKLVGSLSSEWWDPNGPQMYLHHMNPMRVGFIRDGLISTGAIKKENKNKPDVLKGIKILDVGCGAGVLSEALAKYHANVTGLDPSEELIRVARDHIKGQPFNVEYVGEYIEKFSINNAGKFDAVVASEVIEHVPEQREFLIEMTKCLKPNGSLFITAPNRSIVSYFTKYLAEYVFKTLQVGSHVWSHFMTPSEVEKILDEENCKTVYVRGIWYTPFIHKINLSWYFLNIRHFGFISYKI